MRRLARKVCYGGSWKLKDFLLPSLLRGTKTLPMKGPHGKRPLAWQFQNRTLRQGGRMRECPVNRNSWAYFVLSSSSQLVRRIGRYVRKHFDDKLLESRRSAFDPFAFSWNVGASIVVPTLTCYTLFHTCASCGYLFEVSELAADRRKLAGADRNIVQAPGNFRGL